MDETKEQILQRILAQVPDDLDKSEGSFVFDTLLPAAIELALVYIEISQVLQLSFAQTTHGQYLDYRAGEHGLTRKAATKATGQVTVAGSEGSVVPAGFLFSTEAGVQFVTTEEVFIAETGQVSVPIESVVVGIQGNVPANTITGIPISIPGVNGVTNTNPTAGGTDMESDEALLARLLEKVRLPATSGNTAHYLQWAKEVAGVGDAKIFPIWDGPGTVKVVVIDSNKQPAGGDIVQDVADYIENMRPIGAVITVTSGISKTISVVAAVVLTAGYILNDVQNNFTERLREYLKEIAFKELYVSFAQIGSILLGTPGVSDYNNLLINDGNSNIALELEEVPLVGTVTLTV